MMSTLHAHDVDAFERLIELMRAEYREMPGLSLTPTQVCRLWNLDPDVAARAVARLVDLGYLVRNHRGAYARSSSSA